MTGDRFLVEGGHPLRGAVTPAGNKNEALPVLAACLLVRGEVVVDNVPRIRDVAAPIVSPDIRAGMALIGAALCARGTSVIMNAHQVDRGYERIDERLRALGARITREAGA